jgi:protein-S-isoprenylcysteine O-methyltransferase Ste14
MLFFMIYFNNFQRGPIVYTALHGIYGFLWFLKAVAFPDEAFKQKVTLGSAICVAIVLLFYWSFGFLLCSGYGIQRPSGLRMFMAITFVVLGLVLMLVSDAQKYYTLKYKKGLISDGVFGRTRNPNYLGEMMLYAGFAICTGLWFSWIVLITIWVSLFAYRIGLKEYSLMKKDGYQE